MFVRLADGMFERPADDGLQRLADDDRSLAGEQQLVLSKSSERCMSMEQHEHIVVVPGHIVVVLGHRWCAMVQHKRFASGPDILGSTHEHLTCGLMSMVSQSTLSCMKLAASCRMISTHFVVRL